ncbi:MAG TPA: hypothetical protein VF341_01310 [Anaeromyxobacteraceae bacterium]
MGIKKTSKRLAKLGRTATRSLGKGGKKWVEAVFETAIGVIEDELRKKGAKPAKAKDASPELPPRRPAPPTRRKAEATAPKKSTSLAKKRITTPRRRPAPSAAAKRGSRTDLAQAPPERLSPLLQSDRLKDQSLP